MNKEKNFVSAVIYVHNAQERVGVFLRTVISTMEENFEHSEVICVNDASEDKSLDVIRKESSAFSHTSISVVNNSYSKIRGYNWQIKLFLTATLFCIRIPIFLCLIKNQGR